MSADATHAGLYASVGGYQPKRKVGGHWVCPGCRKSRTGRICKDCRIPRPKA